MPLFWITALVGLTVTNAVHPIVDKDAEIVVEPYAYRTPPKGASIRPIDKVILEALEELLRANNRHENIVLTTSNSIDDSVRNTRTSPLPVRHTTPSPPTRGPPRPAISPIPLQRPREPIIEEHEQIELVRRPISNAHKPPLDPRSSTTKAPARRRRPQRRRRPRVRTRQPKVQVSPIHSHLPPGYKPSTTPSPTTVHVLTDDYKKKLSKGYRPSPDKLYGLVQMMDHGSEHKVHNTKRPEYIGPTKYSPIVSSTQRPLVAEKYSTTRKYYANEPQPTTLRPEYVPVDNLVTQEPVQEYYQEQRPPRIRLPKVHRQPTDGYQQTVEHIYNPRPAYRPTAAPTYRPPVEPSYEPEYPIEHEERPSNIKPVYSPEYDEYPEYTEEELFDIRKQQPNGHHYGSSALIHEPQEYTTARPKTTPTPRTYRVTEQYDTRQQQTYPRVRVHRPTPQPQIKAVIDSKVEDLIPFYAYEGYHQLTNSPEEYYYSTTTTATPYNINQYKYNPHYTNYLPVYAKAVENLYSNKRYERADSSATQDSKVPDEKNNFRYRYIILPQRYGEPVTYITDSE